MVVQAFEYEKKYLLSREEAEKKRAEEKKEEEPVAKKAKVDNPQQNNNNGDVRADVYSEPLRGFFKTTSSVMKTPLFRRLDAELRDRRETFLKEMGWEVTDGEKQKPINI